MYPFLRLALELWRVRAAPPLDVTDTHVSRHRCWPQDLDPWVELNNGRTLTLYDLGRIPLGIRTGLARVVRAQGWGLTVAGASIRYRRRIRLWDIVEMRSRCVGWDGRFFYMEQSMWKGEDCTSQMLLRSAVTSASGIVPPAAALQALGRVTHSPDLPGWVSAWSAADALRPWPPHRR